MQSSTNGRTNGQTPDHLWSATTSILLRFIHDEYTHAPHGPAVEVMKDLEAIFNYCPFKNRDAQAGAFLGMLWQVCFEMVKNCSNVEGAPEMKLSGLLVEMTEDLGGKIPFEKLEIFCPDVRAMFTTRRSQGGIPEAEPINRVLNLCTFLSYFLTSNLQPIPILTLTLPCMNLIRECSSPRTSPSHDDQYFNITSLWIHGSAKRICGLIASINNPDFVPLTRLDLLQCPEWLPAPLRGAGYPVSLRGLQREWEEVRCEIDRLETHWHQPMKRNVTVLLGYMFTIEEMADRAVDGDGDARDELGEFGGVTEFR